MRILLKSKIHNALVNQAIVNYEGSISIPLKMLEEADIMEGEQVHIWNVTNGNRLITYAILSEDDRTISVNGAAAKLCFPGDTIIIAAYGIYTEEEAKRHKAKILILNNRNEIIRKYLFPEGSQK